MAEIKKILIPDIGEFDSVDVVEILVSAGEQVAAEDPLISLESDKATLEVPAPVAGRVVEIHVSVGDKVGEGAPILSLEVDPAAAKESVAVDTEEKKSPAPEQPKKNRPAPQPAPSTDTRTPEPPAPDQGRFARAYASPAVRRFARELGADLTRLSGTGRGGRILREDVLSFVKSALAGRERPERSFIVPPMPVIDFSKFGDIERVSLSRIQKIAGPNLQRSWLHVPHVTQHDAADITNLDRIRRDRSDEAKSQGFKLTPVAFIMKAVVTALREHPQVNSSLDPDGEHLILKRYFHIGIAVDTEGGLVVPVIRDVDRKDIFALAGELAELSTRTRAGEITLDDIRGASFTISSLGGIGGTAFTPIVNAPEVAILGVSRARMQPVWQDGKFVPRLMLPLSLSYDHRVVDGAVAARFTTSLCRALADPDTLVPEPSA